MAKPEKRPKITLETLLHVKRHERPDMDFWNSFDSKFERRRLHALVEKKSFFDSIWTPTVKTLAFSAPALLLIGLSALWVRYDKPIEAVELVGSGPEPFNVSSPSLSDTAEKQPAVQALASSGIEGSTSSHFVLDAIENNNSRPGNFRKVLYTPAIKLSIPSGASYVKDSMISRNYGVTTAEMKLARNF